MLGGRYKFVNFEAQKKPVWSQEELGFAFQMMTIIGGSCGA